jgi:hypothetical protein
MAHRGTTRPVCPSSTFDCSSPYTGFYGDCVEYDAGLVVYGSYQTPVTADAVDPIRATLTTISTEPGVEKYVWGGARTQFVAQDAELSGFYQVPTESGVFGAINRVIGTSCTFDAYPTCDGAAEPVCATYTSTATTTNNLGSSVTDLTSYNMPLDSYYYNFKADASQDLYVVPQIIYNVAGSSDSYRVNLNIRGSSFSQPDLVRLSTQPSKPSTTSKLWLNPKVTLITAVDMAPVGVQSTFSGVSAYCSLDTVTNTYTSPDTYTGVLRIFRGL